MLSIRTLLLVFFCAIAVSAQTPPASQDQQPPAFVPPTPPEKSVVYFAHNQDAITDYKTNPRVVRAMVDRLVIAATGQPDIGKAWSSLVAPNDRVGIKISAAGGELFTTHHDVVVAIVDGLLAAGHSRGSIIVWDRSLNGTKGAGYKKGDGFELKSIMPRTGYDP